MKGLYATDPIRKRLEKELKSTVDSIDYSKGKLAEVESKIASIQQRLADTIQGAVLEQINRIFKFTICDCKKYVLMQKKLVLVLALVHKLKLVLTIGHS